MLKNKKAADHFVKTSEHLWQPPVHNDKKTEKKKPITKKNRRGGIYLKEAKNRRGGIYLKEAVKKDDIIDSESDHPSDSESDTEITTISPPLRYLKKV